jgi:hypothetical protein
MAKKVFNFKNVVIFAAMVAAAVLYVSCNKEQTQPKAEISEQAKFEQYVKEARQYASVKWEPNKAKSNKTAIAVDITNPNNPFDYVGALHNQGLDYFINNYQNYPALIKVKNGKKEFSLHEMWKIVGDFGRDNNIQGLRQLTLNPHFRNAMNNELKNGMPSIQSHLSSNAYNYYLQIRNSIKLSSELGNSSSPVCQSRLGYCVDASRQIEEVIMNDNIISAEEKVLLLSTASIARHSFAYWTMVWGDANDTWWNFTNGYKETPDGPSQTAKDDVDGLIGGAVTGGLLGGAAGGILGGIAEYMSASIISIAKQSGYWFW